MLCAKQEGGAAGSGPGGAGAVTPVKSKEVDGSAADSLLFSSLA